MLPHPQSIINSSGNDDTRRCDNDQGLPLPTIMTTESIRLSHGDAISVGIPAPPNPTTASGAGGDEPKIELQRMYFSVGCNSQIHHSPKSGE